MTALTYLLETEFTGNLVLLQEIVLVWVAIGDYVD